MKLTNMARNRAEMLLKKSYLQSMPFHLTIDPGNICNLRCPGCHTGIKHAEMMKPVFLSYEDFKNFLEQCGKYAFNVALYNWGEPFLNKQLFDMIEHSTSKQLGTTVHSNFNHFNESMAENAVKSGLTHIYLSIDGAKQETYETYRVKGKLSKVVDNLRILTETKKKLNSKYPLVTWKYLKFRHNLHEIEDARKVAFNCGADDFEVFKGSPNLCDIQTLAEEYRNNPTRLNEIGKRCNSLWSSVYIGSDGTVFPCSLAFRETESFGNIKNEDFSAVWNNEKYQTARGMFTGEVNQIPSPCSGCVHYLKCINLNP